MDFVFSFKALLLFEKERAAFFHCQLCQLLPDRSGHHVLELYSKAAVQRKEIHYTSEQTAYSFGKQSNVSKLMRGSYWSAYIFYHTIILESWSSTKLTKLSNGIKTHLQSSAQIVKKKKKIVKTYLKITIFNSVHILNDSLVIGRKSNI